MAHGTQQSMSQGFNKAGSTAKRGATRLASTAVNGAKKAIGTGFKTAKNIAKNGIKSGLKATLGASKVVMIFTTPLGWILLALFAFLIIFIAVDAHDPSTTRNYNEDYVRFAEEVPVITSSKEGARNTFLDSELTDYENTGYIGRTTKQYYEYFNDTFDYVFHELCRKEVETVIEEFGYDYDMTMASYLECEDPFMDINYAEIMCVMSQNPNFYLWEGSLTEIWDWLHNEDHVKYLYYMLLFEKLGTSEPIFVESETYTEEDYPYSSKTVGSIVEEEKIDAPIRPKGYSSISSWFNATFNSPSKAELKAYAETVGNEEFTTIGGYMTNGRTLITPLTSDKPSWTFKSTLTEVSSETTKEDVVAEYSKEDYQKKYGNNNSSYKYDASTGTVINIKDGKKVTEEQDVTHTTYTVETSLVATFLYGEIELYPYTLSDLYECFKTDYNDLNTDHAGIVNLNLLDDQEYFLRNYVEEGEEIYLGTDRRTPLFSPLSALLSGNLSETTIELMAMMSDMDISDFQSAVYAISRAYEGKIRYGAQYGNWSTFVCCNYVWEVMHQCGIDICPTNMPAEQAQKLGISTSKDIRYSCTLQSYYFKECQPQAIISRNYNEGMLQVGDIIYTQCEVTHGSYGLSKAESSDHVYIYLGNGYMIEQAGGGIQGIKYSKVSNYYKSNTYMVVRPTLLN